MAKGYQEKGNLVRDLNYMTEKTWYSQRDWVNALSEARKGFHASVPGLLGRFAILCGNNRWREAAEIAESLRVKCHYLDSNARFSHPNHIMFETGPLPEKLREK